LHGTLTVVKSTGAFIYNPDPDYFGQDSFQVKINSAGRSLPEQRLVNIEVQPVPDAPRIEAVPDLENSPTERVTKWPLKVTDPDGGDIAITITITSQDPAIATARRNTETGEIELEPLALGVTTVSIQASDGLLQAVDSFEFRVGRVVRTEQIAIPDPSRHAITVTNNFTDPIDLGLSWNGRTIYESRADMVADATTSVAGDASSRALALWRFVRENSYHALPLASNQWAHDPLLLLNSIGWGLCDDVASALAHLARTAGFEARVWALNRHVVPEIKINNKWQVLDPDLDVYYRNLNGEIASVEELQANPDLIVNPISPLYLPANTYYGYQPFIAEIYASTEDNMVWPWYDEASPAVSGTFTLPPAAKIKFPALWTDVIKDSTNSRPIVYATAKLVLPVGYAGTIRLPLVARAIDGKGRVRVLGRDYEVGSAALDEVMARYWQFIPSVDVLATEEPIGIVMLVNPIGAALKNDNEVRLRSFHAWALQVETEPLPANVLGLDESLIPPPPIDWPF